jgi:hypothetical protein
VARPDTTCSARPLKESCVPSASRESCTTKACFARSRRPEPQRPWVSSGALHCPARHRRSLHPGEKTRIE